MYKKLILFTTLMVLLTACGSTKKFVYLQDMEPGQHYPYKGEHQAVVQIDDRLDITVDSKNPEVAVPFNVKNGNFSVGADGSISNVGGSDNKGYRVDSNGNIYFPVLGELHVAGMTVKEVTDMIRSKIIEGGYIKDPIVTMEFLNFRYSIIGAVNSNGTFSVPGGRITLLEAIAKAGDLTTAARLDRIGVIREENGGRTIYMHDIRSKDIFDSPCFYLQQNDIILVERKYLKKDRGERAMSIFTTVLSTLSSVSTIIWAVTALTNK